MMFDAARKRIYVTGTETATVIQQKDADHYEHVAEVPTGYRSKTSIFIHELNRVYVALLLECRRFCNCESAKLQQDSTEFNKQAANDSTRIT